MSGGEGGRGVLSPGPMSMSGGGEGGREGGVVTRSHVHVRGEGGCCDQVHCPLPPPGVGQTNACENITFATRAVIRCKVWSKHGIIETSH